MSASRNAFLLLLTFTVGISGCSTAQKPADSAIDPPAATKTMDKQPQKDLKQTAPVDTSSSSIETSKATKLQPLNLKELKKRVMGIARGRKDPELLPELRTRLAANPNSKDLLSMMVLFQLGNHQAEESLRYARKLILVAPEDSGAWSIMGMCYTLSGNQILARQATSKAVSLCPDAPSLVALAFTMVQLNDIEGAKAAIVKALSLEKKNPQAWFLAGYIEHGFNNLDKAAQNYKKALKFDPGNQLAYKYLTVVLRKQGREKDLLALSNDFLEHRPNDRYALRQISLSYLGTGNIKMAEKVARKYCEADPASADSWRLKGFLSMQKGKYAEAEKSYLRALAIKPDSQGNICQLAIAYALQGKRKLGTDTLSRLKGRPISMINTVNVAMAHSLLGNREESEKLARKVLAREPNNWRIRLLLASSLSEQKRDKEAIAQFKQALSTSKNTPAALYTYGNFLARKGTPEETAEVLEKCRRFYPDSVVVAGTLAVAWSQSGEPERAKRLARELTKQKPEEFISWFTLGSVNMNLKDRQGALKAFRKASTCSGITDQQAAKLSESLKQLGEERHSETAVSRKVAMDPEETDVWLSVLSLPDQSGSRPSLSGAIPGGQNGSNGHH